MEIDEKKLKQIIDDIGAGLERGHIALRELINEKWEPKKYGPNWYIIGEGIVQKTSVSQKTYRLYGNEFPTKELAETARDMNKRNQLILQAKHEMGYREGWYIIYKDGDVGWTTSFVGGAENPELTFETQEQAETVIKMVGLND